MNLETTDGEVETILTKLDCNKATGVDGIPARILKICAEELAKPIKMLFNLWIQQGRMPQTVWKRANITPVHEDVRIKELVSNYHSISLLSIPAKCLERRIHTAAIYMHHIVPYLSESVATWVYKRGILYITQLALTYPQWAKAFDEGRQIDVVFLGSP